MKRAIIIVPMVLGSVSVASAASNMYDLMYGLSAGKYNYAPSLTMGRGNAAEYTKPNGAPVDDPQAPYKHNVRNYWSFDNTFDYGITNDLKVGVGIGWMISDKNKRKTHDGQTVATSPSGGLFSDMSYNNDGLKDPSIHASYTAYNAIVQVDVLAAFSPKTMDAKRGANNKRDNINNWTAPGGNAARGGHEATLDVNVGKKQGEFGWKANVGVASEFEAEVLEYWDTDLNNNPATTKVTYDQYYKYNVGIDAQYAPMEKLAVGIGFNYLMMPSVIYNGKTYAGTTLAGAHYKVIQNSYQDMTATIVAKYAVMSNLLAHIKMDYVRGSDYEWTVESKHPTTGTILAKATSGFAGRGEYRYGIGANFEF